jgi:DNA-binding CsgD family transcriptional regulator
MYELTKKELEVLALVALAKSDKEIADLHWNSVRTTQQHVHKILVKTGCKNRRELMVLYREEFNVPSKSKYRQIAELLAKKVRPSLIASEVGTTVSYVHLVERARIKSLA